MDHLHTYARELVEQIKTRENAPRFDKKQLRFNDIVDVGAFYGAIGACPRDGVREAVEACIVGDPAHVPGGSVRSMIYPWMVPIN